MPKHPQSIRHYLPQIDLDLLGFFTSLTCAIHCAAVPFLLTMGVFSGIRWIASDWLELTVILLSFVLVSLSFVRSHRRHHKGLAVALLVGGGFVLIFVGHTTASELLEVGLTSAGALLIAASHFWNWKLLQHLGRQGTRRTG